MLAIEDYFIDGYPLNFKKKKSSFTGASELYVKN